MHSRPGQPLRDLQAAPVEPQRAANEPGRLARLLRRRPRRESRPRASKSGPLRALRERLPNRGVGLPNPLAGLSQGARAALRLSLPGPGEGAKARQTGAGRKQRRGASKAPRLGGRGLTLDNKLDILGVLLVLISLALFLSRFSTIRGQVTQLINAFLGNFLGWGALAVPLTLLAVGIWLIVRHFGSEAPVIDPLRVGGGVIFFIGLLLFFQFVDSFNPG